MRKSLKRKTLTAAIWLFTRKVLSKTINIFAIAILARKLSPADFGLVALARVVLNFITGGISQGTATYIIYDNSEDSYKKIITAFYLNVIFILLVVAIILILSPYIVNFYGGSRDLNTIIKMFTLMFVFTELRAIPDAIMKKKLEYNKIVIRDSVLDILSAILSVYMAIAGYGVWSLVYPLLLSSAISH